MLDLYKCQACWSCFYYFIICDEKLHLNGDGRCNGQDVVTLAEDANVLEMNNKPLLGRSRPPLFVSSSWCGRPYSYNSSLKLHVLCFIS